MGRQVHTHPMQGCGHTAKCHELRVNASSRSSPLADIRNLVTSHHCADHFLASFAEGSGHCHDTKSTASAQEIGPTSDCRGE